MEVAAARGEQAVPARQRAVLGDRGVAMAGSLHLDRATAVRLELLQQRPLLVGADPIAARVRDHRDAAGADYPAHGVAQRGPWLLHVAGFAARQVLAEHLVRVAADAGGDQPACEARARNHLRVAGERLRALE